jgi:hypothetical protein
VARSEVFRRKTDTVGHEAAVAQQRQRSREEAWARQQQEEGAAALREQEAAEVRRRMEARAAHRAAEEEARAQRAAEDYRKSPVGQAAAAFERGNQFLQLELSHAQVTGSASASSLTHRPRTLPQQEVRSDLLGEIEAAGWRLLQANWVYVPTPQNGRDKLPTNGSQSVGSGEVMGIYLFRRYDTLVGSPVPRLDRNLSNGSVPVAERQAKHCVQELAASRAAENGAVLSNGKHWGSQTEDSA